MLNTYEIYKAGLKTSITVQDLDVGDMVQLKFHRQLVDENTGKDVINSTFEMYYTPEELKNFLHPFINDMRVRFENADSIQK